jgi:hypothetical protein
MTLNQTVARLRDLAVNHKQINSFRYDNLIEFLNGSDLIYPVCLIEKQEPTIISKADNQTKYKFRIWFGDLINLSKDARTNSNEVESDMMEIAQDYVAMLNYSGFYDDWTITDTTNAVYSEEEFKDLIGTVYIDVEIATNFLSDRCHVPTRLTFEETKDMIIQNTIYDGLGTEGASVTISDLQSKAVLMVFKGDKLLVAVSDPLAVLTPNDYRYTVDTGRFEFGNEIEEEQIIQILNRNFS